MDRDSRGSFLADEECGISHRKQTLYQKKQKKKKKKKKKAEKAFALENLPQLKDQQQLQEFVLNDLMRSVGEDEENMVSMQKASTTMMMTMMMMMGCGGGGEGSEGPTSVREDNNKQTKQNNVSQFCRIQNFILL